jgi:hypothetical protein
VNKLRIAILAVTVSLIGGLPWMFAEPCNTQEPYDLRLCGQAASCPSPSNCAGTEVTQLSSMKECRGTNNQSKHCVIGTVDCTSKMTCGLDEEGACVGLGSISYSTTQRATSPTCQDPSS